MYEYWVILLKMTFFGFSKVKWLQYTGKVGKYTSYRCHFLRIKNVDYWIQYSYLYWNNAAEFFRVSDWEFRRHEHRSVHWVVEHGLANWLVPTQQYKLFGCQRSVYGTTCWHAALRRVPKGCRLYTTVPHSSRPSCRARSAPRTRFPRSLPPAVCSDRADGRRQRTNMRPLQPFPDSVGEIFLSGPGHRGYSEQQPHHAAVTDLWRR